MNQKNTVLVVVSFSHEVDALLMMAKAIADVKTAELQVLGLVAVPDDAPLSQGAIPARRLRQAIHERAHALGVEANVRVTHTLWNELKKTVVEERVGTLIVSATQVPPFEWIRALPCEVMAVKPAPRKTFTKILCPIRGGPHAALALRTALALAEAQSGEITALHITSPADASDQQFQMLLRNLRDLPPITHWIKARGSAVNAIVRASSTHDIVILGAALVPQANEPTIGKTAAEVLKRIKIPALVVRTCPQLPFFLMRDPASPPVDHTISVVVDKWFAENTFHASEFEDLEKLVQLKEQQHLTISLGLPALNEEKTIGKVVKTMRAYLQDKFKLLDEIVVIDSDSTDRTVEIVRDLGVPVYKHSQLLTHYGSWSGKGEALWKSLSVLSGDLIAWIDTDIENIHPRFVYGILGPLIRHPNLMYVKGFYQRPLRLGKKLEARGGGRVTELVARPLLNLFYPGLSGLIQPLAGEYAGRRQALERLPFFAGYGVETGLLIDLYKEYGLHAIGQVDLEERIHKNQSLGALSKMAFEIVQVVMQRIGQTHDLHLVDDLNKSIKLIRHNRAGFQLEVADIRARERPPMLTIPEYAKRYAPATIAPVFELPLSIAPPIAAMADLQAHGGGYVAPETLAQ